MKKISKVAIDLAKGVFQVHAGTERGEVVWRKRVYRSDLLALMRSIPACDVAMEACAGAHFWGRKFQEMGHRVCLIAPQYVKPYVKRNKNDAADADAILEAMSRPTMRFVPVKSVGQQELCQLHRARDLLVRQRTALVNEIKGFAHEFGVVLKCGHSKLYSEYLQATDKHTELGLGGSTLRLFEQLFQQLRSLREWIEKYEKELETLHKASEASQLLEGIDGIGLMTATAVVGMVGEDVSRFQNGREFSASLGLVPRQHSSGERERLGRISKRGDSYLRKLLIQGGHAVVQNAAKGSGPRKEWLRALIARRGKVKAAVAVANKNARIIWALLAHRDPYDAARSVGRKKPLPALKAA